MVCHDGCWFLGGGICNLIAISTHSYVLRGKTTHSVFACETAGSPGSPVGGNLRKRSGVGFESFGALEGEERRDPGHVCDCRLSGRFGWGKSISPNARITPEFCLSIFPRAAAPDSLQVTPPILNHGRHYLRLDHDARQPRAITASFPFHCSELGWCGGGGGK